MKIDLVDFMVFSEGRLDKAASLDKVSGLMDQLLQENEGIATAVSDCYQSLKEAKPSLDCLTATTLHQMKVPPLRYSEMRAKVEAHIRQHFIVQRGKGGCLPK
jgi:hypothetical protein